MTVWPKQSDMNKFYGNPDTNRDGRPDAKWEADNLVRITPPYRMVLAWDTERTVSKIVVHEKCANSLLLCLTKIADHYKTDEAIQHARMHLYGGCYNFRLMRGGSSLSIHSWGAAIDLDPANNGFGKRWSQGIKMMPIEVVNIFRAEGWVWGGKWRKPDAMHFQAANI